MRQAMPIDVPDGPAKGTIANVLATRERSGKTIVTVTWPAGNEPNLSAHRFEYETPRAALDAGWELGDRYHEDAVYMERMRRIYPDE